MPSSREGTGASAAFGDLKGRKIATTLGTTLDYYLDAVLAAQGISRKEVTIVDLSAEKMPDALERGDVDAISTFHPYIVPAQKKLGDAASRFQDKDIYTATFNIVARQAVHPSEPRKSQKVAPGPDQGGEDSSRSTRRRRRRSWPISAAWTSPSSASSGIQHFNVKLDQSLLLALEDESRWAIKNRLVDGGTSFPISSTSSIWRVSSP